MSYLKSNFFRSYIFLLITMLSLQACKSDKNRNKVRMETTQSKEVFKAYLDLRNALIDSDKMKAQKHAYSFAEAFNKEENDLVLLAVTISEVDDLEEQRTLFYQLSQRMEDFISDNLKSGKVYKQYCPLAFVGDGAYWFSLSEEIRNPYFGHDMLHCGSIQKTIE